MAQDAENMVDIEVHYTCQIPDSVFRKLQDYAEQQGHGYNDPGKQEIVRRLLMDEGMTVIEEIEPGCMPKYTRHK